MYVHVSPGQRMCQLRWFERVPLGIMTSHAVIRTILLYPIPTSTLKNDINCVGNGLSRHCQGFFRRTRGTGELPFPLKSISPLELFDKKRSFSFLQVKWRVFHVRAMIAFHPLENFTFYPSPPVKKLKRPALLCVNARLEQHVQFCWLINCMWLRPEEDNLPYFSVLELYVCKKMVFSTDTLELIDIIIINLQQSNRWFLE